ncbi:MAG: SHOCT domain-containing protein [Candidatus Dojkabacteria bacterium]|jgi:ABC-type transport system involved in multi-copper enzyme maturation permease subunit
MNKDFYNEETKKLKELMSEGIITKEEFLQEKKKLEKDRERKQRDLILKPQEEETTYKTQSLAITILFWILCIIGFLFSSIIILGGLMTNIKIFFSGIILLLSALVTFPPFRSWYTKKLKVRLRYALIVSIILHIIGVGIFVSNVMKDNASTKNINNSPTEQEKISKTEAKPQVKTQTFQPYLNAEDFKKKSISSIQNIYGKAIVDYKDPPVSSMFSYSNDSYDLEAFFTKNDQRLFGAHVFIKKMSCTPNSINEDTVKEALKYVQLEKYADNPNWIKKQTYYTHFRINTIDGWDFISVQCSSNTNNVAVSFMAEGWDRY